MPHKSHQLRIIGGQWRSRIITFPDVDSIRPTPNRVRETLFNWLQPSIANAACLDLFAGSGALGFEALSRGASHVTFVDQHPLIISHLQTSAQQLQTSNMTCVHQDALSFISNKAIKKFNIIFLDPPFALGLMEPCLHLLFKNDWVAPEGLVYIEQPSDLNDLTLPAGASLARYKRASNVFYGLIQACG